MFRANARLSIEIPNTSNNFGLVRILDLKFESFNVCIISYHLLTPQRSEVLEYVFLTIIRNGFCHFLKMYFIRYY